MSAAAVGLMRAVLNSAGVKEDARFWIRNGFIGDDYHVDPTS